MFFGQPTMPLSPNDQQLWASVIKHVQPLDHKQISHVPGNLLKSSVIQHNTNHHTLDLHGMTLAAAHERIQDHLRENRQSYKFVTIITGKSGALSDLAPRWIEQMPHVGKVDHADHKGSVKVWFKRTQKKK